MLLNVCLTVLRFMLPVFISNSYDDVITWLEAPIQGICFLFEYYMIYYFWDTSIKFVKILSYEEKINITKARILVGIVSLALFFGKFDYYIVHFTFQLNLVFWNNKYCNQLLNVAAVSEYFHNTMPFTVGMFILYVVYFMARSLF